MKVIIDGVEYVPAAKILTDKGLLDALEVRFDSDAGDNLTVRDYLRVLLETLWEKGEGFSGKCPFGNSGWEYDLYRPLIAAVSGKLDDDGFVEHVDKGEADPYVFKLILAAFYGVSQV